MIQSRVDPCINQDAKIRTFVLLGDNNMKRTSILFLPLLLLTVSCGNLSQYTSQKYFDSIYGTPVSAAQDEVVLYSSEDFERMAAANLAQAEV